MGVREGWLALLAHHDHKDLGRGISGVEDLQVAVLRLKENLSPRVAGGLARFGPHLQLTRQDIDADRNGMLVESGAAARASRRQKGEEAG